MSTVVIRAKENTTQVSSVNEVRLKKAIKDYLSPAINKELFKGYGLYTQLVTYCTYSAFSIGIEVTVCWASGSKLKAEYRNRRSLIAHVFQAWVEKRASTFKCQNSIQK